jgi:hypothetical protein
MYRGVGIFLSVKNKLFTKGYVVVVVVVEEQVV